MTIIACPRCKDEVRAPSRAPDSAIVRCPLCAEEYRLGDALKQLPPELIVVSGMSAADDHDPYQSPAEAAYGVDDYRVAESDAGMGGGVFDTTGPGDSGAAVSRPRVSGARPKRKEKSMVGEMVKVVLGGVVGCSLAIPIIWWLGKTDPFELGPMVSPYAPWAVPAQFHAPPKNTTTTAATTPNDNNVADNNTAPQSNGGGQKKSKQPKLQTMEDLNGTSGFDPEGKFAAAASGNSGLNDSLDPLAGGPNLTPFGSNDSPSIEDPLALPSTTPSDPLIADPLDPLGALNPPAEQPMKTQPNSGAKKNGKRKSNPPAEPNLADLNTGSSAPTTPETNPPETTVEPAIPTPADLAAGVQSAVATRDAYAKAEADGAPGAVRRDLGGAMFNAISDIGPVLAKLSPQDSENADAIAALDEMLHGFGDAQNQAILAYFADQRLANDPTAEGILLAGTVKDFKAVGGAFETTIELANKKRSVQVVTFKSPQDDFKIDDHALIVGRIVHDPKSNLRGYEGDEPLVIVSSYNVVVPAE